jgi:DNA (cytosine-5)-methyltransferase 1
MSSSKVKRRFSLIPPGLCLRDLAENGKVPKGLRVLVGHHGVYRRLNPSIPSITITNVRKSLTIHPIENRIISIREAARLQSFPDTYRFPGTISFMQQAVANAVPPLLMRSVARQIYYALN